MNARTAGRTGFLLILPLLALLLAGGCTGSANNNSVPFEAGKGHPDGFATTHPTLAMADSSVCTPCHGADLRGGTSRVSCAGSSFNGIACHAGGPGHGTADWVDNVHFLRAKANLASCKVCHGDDLRGGTSGLSCYSASFDGFGACHTSGPDHILVADWATNHNLPSLPDGTACKPCHGADLRGGKSGVSCALAACHGNTFGPSFHPARWLDFTAGINFHGDAYQINNPQCSNCHDVTATSQKCANTCHYTLGGGKVPPSPPNPSWSHPTSGTSNSTHYQFTDNSVTSVCVNCHATHNRFGQAPVCHNCHPPFPGGNHDNGWLQSHAPAARAGTASCAAPSGANTCHGTNLAGGDGRACTVCHTGEALASNLSGCRSCHGNPPPGTPPLTQPNGVFPNIAGAHAKHAALAGVTCATCHTGAGMTTTRHFDTILQVVFAAGYNAQTGTIAYTGAATRTCNATICHGGQATPDWRRTPATLACTACHRVRVTTSPQFTDLVNTAFVAHTGHAGRGCTNCHNMALTGVNHWSSLTDRGIPAGRARASIVSGLNYAPPGGSESNCTTSGIGNCH